MSLQLAVSIAAVFLKVTWIFQIHLICMSFWQKQEEHGADDLENLSHRAPYKRQWQILAVHIVHKQNLCFVYNECQMLYESRGVSTLNKHILSRIERLSEISDNGGIY